MMSSRGDSKYIEICIVYRDIVKKYRDIHFGPYRPALVPPQFPQQRTSILMKCIIIIYLLLICCAPVKSHVWVLTRSIFDSGLIWIDNNRKILGYFLIHTVKETQFNPKYKLRRAPCGPGPYTAACTLLSVHGSVHVVDGAPRRARNNPVILVNLIVS